MGKVSFVELEYGDAAITLYSFPGTPAHTPIRQWHRHVYYELHFSLDATAECRFSDKNMLLHPGEVLIIPPSVIHESITCDVVGDIVVLSVELKKCDGIRGFYDIITSALNTAALTPVKLSGLGKEVLQVFGNKELYRAVLGVCRLKACASQVIYSLFSAILEDSPCNEDCEKVKVLVDNLILRPDMTVSQIAKAANYSERQVSRLIKKQYGMPLTELRRQIKMEGKDSEN